MVGYVDAGAYLMIAGIIVGAIIVLGVYLLPSIIAIATKKENKAAIIVLNIFLAWSFVGWVISLVWACKKDKKQSIEVTVTNNQKVEK